MTWNPKEQECRGYFGYGSGYFMEETEAKAKTAKGKTRLFCNGECPIWQDCWAVLHDRVREENPEAVEIWDQLVDEGAKEGFSPGMIAAGLLAEGRPDPWIADMLANLNNGVIARAGFVA